MPRRPNHLRRTLLHGRAALAGFALLAMACQGSPAPAPAGGPSTPTATVGSTATVGPPLVKVAVFEDLSVQGSGQQAQPAFQAVQLRIDQAIESGELDAEVEVVAFDTGGDMQDASSLAEEVAADPTYVVAVGAPFFGQQEAVRPSLQRAGLPFVSLGTLAPRIGKEWPGWFRVVPDQVAQARSLAALALQGSPGRSSAGNGVCVAGDGSAISQDLSERVAARLRKRLVLTLVLDQEQAQVDEVPGRVDAAGCDVLVWTGFSAEAAQIRIEMMAAGLKDVLMLGSDAMKDDAYLTATGAAGRRTIVTCPCVDLSTATDLAAQRFIHDYQSEFGTPPGAYAAEAWDVAGMLVGTLSTGGSTRAAVALSLRDPEGFHGLAGTYAFGEDGELDPPHGVNVFRDEGSRWIPIA